MSKLTFDFLKFMQDGELKFPYSDCKIRFSDPNTTIKFLEPLPNPNMFHGGYIIPRDVFRPIKYDEFNLLLASKCAVAGMGNALGKTTAMEKIIHDLEIQHDIHDKFMESLFKMLDDIPETVKPEKKQKKSKAKPLYTQLHGRYGR